MPRKTTTRDYLCGGCRETRSSIMLPRGWREPWHLVKEQQRLACRPQEERIACYRIRNVRGGHRFEITEG